MPSPSSDSPFRTKGVLYIGTQTFFEEHLQGGAQELYDDIPDPELRAFISQRFLPSGWYDVMPVPDLIAYEAKALRMREPDYLRHRTRWQAERDLRGVYKWLLRLASPGMVATRLPKVMTQMFEFADARTERASDQEVVVRLSNIPEVLEGWFLNALGVYADAALKLAGARHTDTRIHASDRVGEKAGVPLHELTMRIDWE